MNRHKYNYKLVGFNVRYERLKLMVDPRTKVATADWKTIFRDIMDNYFPIQLIIRNTHIGSRVISVYFSCRNCQNFYKASVSTRSMIKAERTNLNVKMEIFGQHGMICDCRKFFLHTNRGHFDFLATKIYHFKK